MASVSAAVEDQNDQPIAVLASNDFRLFPCRGLGVQSRRVKKPDQTFRRRSLLMALRTRLCLAFVAVSAGLCNTASAQELVPRAYWPSPNGTNVFVLAYQKSSGDIVTDPSLPLIGVESDIDYLQLSYQKTFSLAGRTATVQLSLPYSRGDTEGFVENQFRQRHVAGIADTRVRLAVNLKGAPSMDAAGFQSLRQNPKPIVGASVLLQAPTGKYEADKVINIGTNRWAIKPAIGAILPIKPTWLFEFEIGGWFYSDNDDFLGQTREQGPILSTEFHLVKRIRPGLWASLDANFYVGGRTRIGDVESDNLQRNSHVGATIVSPIRRGHALRGSFSTGAVTESGGDFNMYSLSYVRVW